LYFTTLLPVIISSFIYLLCFKTLFAYYNWSGFVSKLYCSWSFMQVFRHLVEKINCRLLFATHYHPLTKEFASHPHVSLQYMACAFKSKPESYSKSDRELVFLYRLASGACPGSYGLQVATMAGIPEHVVEAASHAGQLMKNSTGESFKSSEWRSEFSTLHEEWLKTLVNVSRIRDCNFDDDDVYDTLFCLWHELKSSYESCSSKSR